MQPRGVSMLLVSLLVSKLAAYPQHSELALALRELGRVERTLFTLDWLRQPELRRRANTGLNKGELRNALAKALRFYRRGAVADRDREEQQRKASGLNLVIAAISLWNTVYLQKAIRATTEAGNPVPEDLIPHLSFRHDVIRHWWLAVRRRGQRPVRRAVFDRWVSQYLPTPAILHPYPLERIGAKYPNIQGKNRVR